MRPGEVIVDRFEIERRVGVGGMGEVYRALDRRAGGVVAIKVLHARLEAEAFRFTREAEVLADQQNPGIVRYVAHGEMLSGEAYLAMEWLEGETLAERLCRAGINAVESVMVVARVAAVLGAVHARGVVHRDLKPSNIFLQGGSLEAPILIDFGVARIARPGPELTVPGTIVGTPGYMAPEQAHGEPDVDARADVFSLGCVLFRCLTGHPPFVGDDVLAVLLKVVLEEPPRLHELRPDLPLALDALVTQMLSKTPSLRPKDGAQVAEALAALGDDLEASSRRTPGSISEAPELTTTERRVMCLVVARRDRARTASTLSTSVAETRQDELEAMVARHQGRIDVLADGSIVVALASAGAATDLAARAAQCALSVESLLEGARLAIVSGRAVLEPRLPVGELIERAVALLRLEPSAIRLDEVTAGLLADRFEVSADAAGPRLLGEHGAVVGTRTLLGKSTPCVGREREIALLEMNFARGVEEGTAGAVLVTAAAGVGKSRLCHELLRRLRERGEAVQVWMGRGDPMTAGSAFSLLGQAIRGAVGLLDGEPVEARRRRLHDHMAALLRDDPGAARRVSVFLGELAGTPFDDDDDVQLRAARREPTQMGDQMRRAFEHLLAASCAARPVLLVLEDLQWGDLPTVRFVDSALRNLHDHPLFVLALARPEITALFPDLWAGRPLLTVQLPELGRRACERLVHAVLGEEVSAATLKATVDRSLGNAFYLEELIRAVAEGKEGSLPETVLSMVQARLEAFDGEARRGLRAASVFGKTFWRGGVSALLGGADVDSWIELLVEREVIAPSGEGREGAGKFPDEVEYRFRHALIREAAYGMLTDRDREVGHRLAGEWLERAGEGDAMALAEHFERGGIKDRAATWYRRAAEQAFEGNDFAATIDRAERGAACLASVGAADGEALGLLRLLQAGAYRWRGENAEAERAGVDAIALLACGSAPWFGAAGELLLVSGKLGNTDRLVELSETLLGCARQGGGSTALAVALGNAARCARFFAEQHALADALREAAEVLIQAFGAAPEVLALVHSDRATSAISAGDVGEYLRWSEAARASFRQAGNLRDGCNQAIWVGYAQLELGAHADAERTLREALREAEAMGMSAAEAHARHNLGMVLALLGKTEEALVIEEEALAAYRAQGHQRGEAGARIYLARMSKLAGDLERSALEAARVAEEPPSPSFKAYSRALLADARLDQGRAAEALEEVQEAVVILGSLGAIEEGEALVRVVYAAALDAAGDPVRAREVLAEARDRLLDRAARIADPVRRRSFLERVPDNARTLDLARRWLGPTEIQ